MFLTTWHGIPRAGGPRDREPSRSCVAMKHVKIRKICLVFLWVPGPELLQPLKFPEWWEPLLLFPTSPLDLT